MEQQLFGLKKKWCLRTIYSSIFKKSLKSNAFSVKGDDDCRCGERQMSSSISISHQLFHPSLANVIK